MTASSGFPLLSDVMLFCKFKQDMICSLYGFPCEMEFSHYESPNPIRVACDDEEGGIRRQVVINPYHMGSHTKMHFLAYFTLQDTLIMINTLVVVVYFGKYII